MFHILTIKILWYLDSEGSEIMHRINNDFVCHEIKSNTKLCKCIQNKNDGV